MNKQAILNRVKSTVTIHNWHKHPLVLPAALVLLFFFMSLALFVSSGATTMGASDARVVSLTIDGEEQVVPTRAQTVGELLERVDIELRDSDVIVPSLDSEIVEDNFQIEIYTSRAVMIIDKGEKTVIETAEPAPHDVLAAAGIEVYPEDIVEKDASNPISAHDVLEQGVISERLVVKRATPVVLSLFGVDYEMRTHAKTVRELLEERDINIAEATVFPEPDTELIANKAVFVTDPNKEIVLEEEVVEQSQEYVDDATLAAGQTRVRSEGEPGRKAVVYEILEDGTRKTLQEVIIVQPKNRIIERGTKPISRSNEAILYDLRSCESGGNYQVVSRSGSFHGAYQFMPSTWDRIASMVGRPDLVGVLPSQASPADQDFMVIENAKLSAGGFHSQHPHCSSMLNLPKFPN